MDGRDFDVTVLGKSMNLQREWQTIALQLGSMDEANMFVENSKEIARLKTKVLHLQEEVDGYRAHNKDLLSMNDDLVERVKTLISIQDVQLEQYSSALMLMTEERRKLWHNLGTSKKHIKHLENLIEGHCNEDVRAQLSVDKRKSLSNEDAITSDNIVNHFWPTNETGAVEGPTSIADPGVKHLESSESSLENTAHTPKPAQIPVRSRGCFVNSMVDQLEKKQKLKSFDEPKPKKTDDGAFSPLFEAERGGANSNSSSDAEAENLKPHELPHEEKWKSRVLELEQEVHDLRSTCQSLTGMLERTYDEIQMSLEQDDTKDRLIACLRSRLLEAICDLMKLEKRRLDVKSVASGSSLPRPEKDSVPEDASTEPFPSHSPSRSVATRLLESPAKKLKAIKEENYGRLRRLTCWKLNTPDDSG